ncbi:MAG: hypothetical protein AAGD23_05840 [Pseudomonadota bacterium]
MIVIRIVYLLAGIGFAAIIIWAFGVGDFGASFTAILADPWGVVALADLYLGFLLFAFIIAGFEASALRATVWIVALVVLGNTISAIWLALNAPQLWRRIRPAT